MVEPPIGYLSSLLPQCLRFAFLISAAQLRGISSSTESLSRYSSRSQLPLRKTNAPSQMLPSASSNERSGSLPADVTAAKSAGVDRSLNDSRRKCPERKVNGQGPGETSRKIRQCSELRRKNEKPGEIRSGAIESA